MSAEVQNGCEMIEARVEGSGLPEIVFDVAFPRPERVYSHALLVQLKEHPVAQRWPPYLDPIYKNARGVWEPDRWHHDRKRGDTPVSQEEKEKPMVSGGHNELLPTKRPREKELDRVNVLEEDSIVLSPQRRSFLTGCQASQDELVLKPEQPGGGGAGRRVGSGRLLARETKPEEYPLNKLPRARNERELGREPRDAWDREGRPGDRDGRPGGGEIGGGPPGKFAFRRDQEEDHRLRGVDDRRSYYQHDMRDGRGGGGGNLSDRRMMGGGVAGRGRLMGGGGGFGGGGGMKRIRQEMEPEWASESVSLSDTIELRGFDEPKPALQPGMSLEELEHLQQQQEVDQRHQHPAKPEEQRPPSRVSTKSDKEAAANANSLILADFLKAGRGATSQQVADSHGQQQQAALPASLMEAIMGGGGQAAAAPPPPTETAGADFNFDSIMMEMIGDGKLGSSILPQQPPQQQEPSQQQQQQQSRFSQFFAKPVPEPAAAAAAVSAAGPQLRQSSGGSRRSSIQDELSGASILREINGEATIRIPSGEEGEAGAATSSSKYFTPISPAAKTAGPPPGGSNLLEMLQKSGHQQQQQQQGVRQLEDGIKRSLGLGDVAAALGSKQQPQFGFQKLQGAAGPPPPPGLQHQFPGGLLGFPPHHLQAALRPPPQHRPQPQQSQESDMSAFKKLVAQVKGAGPPSNAPLMAPPGDAAASLLALMRQSGGGGGGGGGGGSGAPVHLYTEQDLLEGRAKGQRGRFSHPAIPAPLLKFLEQYPWNPEVLKRPDAEHLILGLNSGAFSLENIVQQLSNPALQVRQRELFLNVLKMKTSGLPPPPPPNTGAPFLGGLPLAAGGPGGLLPPRTSPLPGQQPFAAHHQHAAAAAAYHGGRGVSPLMGGIFLSGATNHLSVSPAPVSQRVPSPQEMTVLTQQIMQQALINRKLEEQKENYRRRQGEVRQEKEDKENIRGGRNADSNSSGASATGGGGGSIITGSPLAFTPTSVMRKNAAERKDSDPRIVGVPELKINSNQERSSGRTDRQAPPSPGRPITKAKTDRPGRLELMGGPPQQQQRSRESPSSQAAGPGLLGPAPSSHHHQQAFNPLLFLQNSQMRPSPITLEPVRHQDRQNSGGDPRLHMDSGYNSGSSSNSHLPAAFLAAAAAAGMSSGGGVSSVNNAANNRLPAAFLAAAAATPPSSCPQQAGNNSSGGTPLARFFSPDVLAAAQGGACPPMPPLPIRQALTLEEIERQAAAAAVRI